MRKRAMSESTTAGSPTGIDKRSRQDDGQFVVALARGMEILSVFSGDQQELSNSELSEITGQTKPTLTRYTFTLMKMGYLRYNEKTAAYSLGPGVISLAAPYLRERGFIANIRPEIEEVADFARASVSITARRNLEMVYLFCIKGPSAVGLRLDTGAVVPIATTSHGRAYLSAISKEERAAILGQISEAEPERTDDLIGKIEDARQQVTERGFCAVYGEWSPDVNAVAVPLTVPGSPEVFTINCGGLSSTLTREIIESEVGPRLTEIRDLLCSRSGAA